MRRLSTTKARTLPPRSSIHNHSFILAAGSGDDTRAFGFVHVASFTTDESLVKFNAAVTAEFTALLSLLGESDVVKHKPAVFWVTSSARAISQLLMPFLAFSISHMQSSSLFRPIGLSSKMVTTLTENWFGMPIAALPAKLILEKTNGSASASWANNAVVPFGPTRYKIVQVVLLIREVKYRFLKALRFVFSGFYTYSYCRSLY